MLSTKSFAGARIRVSQRPVVAARRTMPVMASAPTMNAYETLMVLRPDLADDERDRQLAKFESFLGAEGASTVQCDVKGRQRMAYPIKGHWEGTYAIFTYKAQGPSAKKVQQLLANPDSESQGNILRWQSHRI